MSYHHDLEDTALLGSDLDELWGDHSLNSTELNEHSEHRGQSKESSMLPPETLSDGNIISSLEGTLSPASPRGWLNTSRASDRNYPPPSWQSEEADKEHRQEMILEIARLLKGRKKSHPSKSWLQELPHKAHELEYRLYLSADSLESYLEKGTLKERLKKVAKWFMKQYHGANRKNRMDSARSSFASRDSNASRPESFSLSSRPPMRDSITSVSSSQPPSHRGSVLSTTSLDSLSSLQEAMNVKNQIVSDPYYRASTQTAKTAEKTGSTSSTESWSEPEKVATDSYMQGDNDENETQGQASETSSTLDLTAAMTDLERQKQTNAELQEQIMKNIRAQEELAQRLQNQSNLMNPVFAGPSSNVMQHQPMMMVHNQPFQHQQVMPMNFQGNSMTVNVSHHLQMPLNMQQHTQNIFQHPQSQQMLNNARSSGSTTGSSNMDAIVQRQAALLDMMGVRRPAHLSLGLTDLGSAMPRLQSMNQPMPPSQSSSSSRRSSNSSS